jgi:non-heme chloroperoxidase
MQTSTPTIALPAVIQGAPDGVPVVMLHGLSDSWHSFAPLLAHLPPAVRAIAVTQRGHGDAPRPGEGYTPEVMAADVVATLDELGVERAVVLGHSMGSHVALRLALDAPERVRGLLLAGAVTSWPKAPGLDAFLDEVLALRDPVPEPFAREFQVSTLAQPIADEQLDLFVAESLKLPAAVWHAIAEGFRDSDLDDDLSRIDVPTQLLWGAQDAYFPRTMQDGILAAVAGSRIEVYAAAGHALHWEEPERFAADVAAFAAAC